MLAILLLALCVSAYADTILYQSDFDHGTYRITQPGRYVLGENISFYPNPHPDAFIAGRPLPEQLSTNGGPYPADAYGLGFFAAITVETDNVQINLNGYTLEQGALHALCQRFFALIELENSPFLPGQGPHSFTTNFFAASHVVVSNGVLGRSSHHGIRGNGNVDVVVENVQFVDYEVAGIAFNGPTGLRILDCTLTNRKDIPVLGIFSSAMFIKPYLDYLVEEGSPTTLKVQGQQLSAAVILEALRSSVNNVAADVQATGFINSNTHPSEFALYDNHLRLIDGNSYSVLLNKIGVAINGFPLQPQAPYTSIPASDVEMRNVDVVDQQSMIHEIVGLRQGGTIVTDPVGSVIQLLNKNANTMQYVSLSSNDLATAEYTGSVILNAQMLVGKAILEGEFFNSPLSTIRSKVGQAMIDWVEAGGTANPMRQLGFLTAAEGWQCNGDSMAHVQKGAVAFKIDASVDVRISECSVNGLSNLGHSASPLCGDYEFSHPAATLSGYNGAHARGFSFSGSNRVRLNKVSVVDVASTHGNAYGYDIFTDSSNIRLQNTVAFLVRSQHSNATGYHLGGATSYSDLQNYCAAAVSAPEGTALAIWDENGVRNNYRNDRCP